VSCATLRTGVRGETPLYPPLTGGEKLKPWHMAVAIAGLVLAWWLWTGTVTCSEVCQYHSKRMVPAHTEYWIENHCTMYDKDGGCSMSIPIQHSRWVPDKFLITFTDCKQSWHEYDVDERVYHEPPLNVIHSHFRWRVCPCGGN
jgi:hypothetical protein